jgi:tripartite-type tricarboxylate transporter receptor subunit TctC
MMAGIAASAKVRRVALAAGVLCAAVLGCGTLSFAQTYPTGVVKLIVPFPGGGPLDFVARLLAEKLSGSLKQPFIIDNRPGAAGNIGTDAAAKAAPDGHTLLFVLDTPLTVNPALYKKLPFDPERDFVPISIVASFSQMLVVHPSLPVASLPELVAYAKKQGDRPMFFGSGGGNGSPGQLTMEYFRMRAGFSATHVPYRGNAQVVTDLIGGQVPAGFVAAPGVLQHVKDGRLKALAVSSARRAELAPDVPTVREVGYPDFDVRFYQVMLAPAGISEAIRALLEREVQHALQSPELREKLRHHGLEPIGSTAAEATAQLKAIAKHWSKVVSTANIKPE